MRRVSIFIFINIVLVIFSSCYKDEAVFFNETTLSIDTPANEFVINRDYSDIIVEERTERQYADLPVDNNSVITIGDKLFLTKIYNIKNKIDEYKDKTIVVEGMFATYNSWDDTFQSYLVYRNGPNDFNNDIWGGFFLDSLLGNDIKIDDWIKVEGTPYIYNVKDSEGDDFEYLFLKVLKIDILSDKNRGIEFVND